MSRYRFENNDRELIERLAEKWQCLTEELQDFNFEYEEFQQTAIETFPYIAKFSGKDFPLEIAKLLLSIRSFAVCNNYVNSTSEAARLVAETFCDLEEYSGVTSFSFKEYIVLDDAELEVGGPSKFYIIDKNTFDLSELIADIEENWQLP